MAVIPRTLWGTRALHCFGRAGCLHTHHRHEAADLIRRTTTIIQFTVWIAECFSCSLVDFTSVAEWTAKFAHCKDRPCWSTTIITTAYIIMTHAYTLLYYYKKLRITCHSKQPCILDKPSLTQIGQHSPSGIVRISPFSHTGLRQSTAEQSIPVGGHISAVTHILLTVSMTCPGGQVHPCTQRVLQIWLGSESQVVGHGDAQSLKTWPSISHCIAA